MNSILVLRRESRGRLRSFIPRVGCNRRASSGLGFSPLGRFVPIDKLGRYEIVRELGKGAMGVVYLARDPVIGRLVALKTVRGPASGEDDSDLTDFHERFLREAQAAGTLSHPCIVTIHDVGEDEASGTTFLAMEYIEGRNLKACLADREPLALSDIVSIATQVAEALDYAHRKGIVHRDIKPANIIITTEGRVKIADFGIAKIATSSLTTTGKFLGTPKYMSPEQVTGAPVDGRSDLFSLGMVFYEMLTRQLPFLGDNMTTISYKIAHEDFIPPSRIVEGLPEEMDRIAYRALAKEPWNRYQRGNEFAADLRQIKLPGAAPPLRRLSRGAEGASLEFLGSTQPASGSAPALSAAEEAADVHTVAQQPPSPGSGIHRPRSGTAARPGSGAGLRPPSGAAARPPSGPTSRPASPPSGPVAAEPAKSGLSGFLRTRANRLIAGVLLAAALLLVLILLPRHGNDSALLSGPQAKPRARGSRSLALPAFLQDSDESAGAGQASTSEGPSTSGAGVASETAPSEGQKGTLHVLFSSSLPSGTLHIESRSKLLLHKRFSSSLQGLDELVPIAPGDLNLKVTLNAADGSFRGSQTVQGQIGPGETRTLRVSLFKDHLLAILEN